MQPDIQIDRFRIVVMWPEVVELDDDGVRARVGAVAHRPRVVKAAQRWVEVLPRQCERRLRRAARERDHDLVLAQLQIGDARDTRTEVARSRRADACKTKQPL
eukprot:1691612-Pleurochrysis_carterae.AAC.5